MLSKLFFTLCLSMGLSAFTGVDATVTTEASESLFTPFTGKIRGNKVRLRAEPNLDSEIIKELSKGDFLVVTGEASDYYTVRAPSDAKAYVFRTYVLDDVIEGSHVNVRLRPDLDAPIVAQLNSGDRVVSTANDSHSKWMEIEHPSTVPFYVAREYIENIGSENMLAELSGRRQEGQQRLSEAHLSSQSELGKSFTEMSIDRLNQVYTQIMEEYADLPDIATMAEEGRTLLQDTFLDKKIAFLEAKARGTQSSWSDQTAEIDGIVSAYKEKLAELESKYLPASEKPAATETEAATDATEPATAALQATNPNTHEVAIWGPIETAQHQRWVQKHGNISIEEFYQTERQSATTLSGVLKPFKWSVKNKPGDYLLVSARDQVPVAYLYSVQVDLNGKVGQTVTVKGAPRPNNHFAFPAFHVLSVE